MLFLLDRHKYIAYGGARGGGKSWAVRVKAALLCLRYAGIRVMIVRRTYPELRENHIKPLCEMLRCYHPDKTERIASYNDQKKTITLRNGSEILFRYCDNEKDALRFQGTEVDVLFVDEATQQTEECMDKLKACVRGVNDFPKRIYYTCNPGGVGHEWVKRLFIDRRYKDEENPEEYSFIQALPTDNYALMEKDPGYLNTLDALPPKLRRAWRYGEWDIFEGMFFDDFRTEPDMATAKEHGCELTPDELREQHRWTHVIPAFDLNAGNSRGWNIVRSYDFGYGEIPGGYTLSDGYMTVYGAHLNGSGTTEMPDELKPLLTSLENGGFVRWLVNFLYDALVPQLQLLLDAPIRTVDTMAPLAAGKGFDIAAALKTNPSGMIDSLAKDNLSKYAFKSNSENGYYSLNGLLKDVYALLTGDEFGPLLDKVLSLFSGALGDTAGTIINLIPTVKEYLGMYVDGGTDLGKTLDDALIDKYVTDAFCKNLGDYAKQILESFYIDTTFDHAYENAKATGLFKAYGENYLVTCTYNGEKLFGGHTYDSSVAVNVVPTTENGLKPGRISYTFGDNVYTDKNFMWFTSVQVDIFDRTVVPESFIRYSTNENLSASTTVKANGENVLNEIPTIDLGIAYFNLNYAMKTYNRYTVSLTGLEEGKTYFYQVGNDAYGWSDVYSFTTGKTSGGFEFMAFSDIQGSVERNYVDSMNNLYKATVSTGKTTSFILSGGDNVDNGKNFWQYMWMLDHQAQSWANNTYVSVAGNHEKHHYDLTSNLATPSGATVLETGIYYSYNYQNTHFVILDTNDLDSEGNLAETQTEWLEADLAEADKDESITFIIVTMHKGPYTAGSHAFDSDVIALRKQLTPIFAVYGVNLVLQGHDHTYSVSEYIDENGEKADVTYNYDGSVVTDGVLYVNLGTMGDKFYNYLYSDEVLIKTRDNAPKGLEKYLTADKYLELTETPVYANVSVDGDRITLKSYAYLADGSVVAVDNIMIARGALEAPKSKLPVGAVIGITVGAVALVGGIVCLFVFLGKKKTPIAA